MATTRTKNPPPVLQLDKVNGEVEREEEEALRVDNDPIEIVDEGATTPAEEVVDDSVETLRAQLEEEKRRREEAEQRAERVERDKATTDGDLLGTQLRVVESAINEAEAKKREAKAAMLVAKQTGDYEGEIEAEDQLQQINLNLKTLGNGKAALQQRIEDRTEFQKDPVEGYAKTLSQKAGSWVRAHPDMVRDPGKLQRMVAAHNAAVGREGLVADSPEYFDFIEKRLGLTEGTPTPERTEEPVVVTTQPRRNAPPAAPPSRAAASVPGARPVSLPQGVEHLGGDRYRLTPELREYAQIAGQTEAEYLKQLLKLHRAGELGRTTH